MLNYVFSKSSPCMTFKVWNMLNGTEIRVCIVLKLVAVFQFTKVNWQNGMGKWRSVTNSTPVSPDFILGNKNVRLFTEKLTTQYRISFDFFFRLKHIEQPVSWQCLLESAGPHFYSICFMRCFDSFFICAIRCVQNWQIYFMERTSTKMDLLYMMWCIIEAKYSNEREQNTKSNRSNDGEIEQWQTIKPSRRIEKKFDFIRRITICRANNQILVFKVDSFNAEHPFR